MERTYPGNATMPRREGRRLYFFKKLWYNIIRKLRKEGKLRVFYEPTTPEEYEADVRKSFQEV
jgi:protein associated with RNAse G/E